MSRLTEPLRSTLNLSSPQMLSSLLLLLPLALCVPAAAQFSPTEVCDGIDNDLDGDIDEGYDFDGDGVARCCDQRAFFVTTTTPGNEIWAHSNHCSNTFDASITPIAALPAGDVIQVNGVGHVDADGLLDVIWTDTGTNARYRTTCNGVEWVTNLSGFWGFGYFGGADIDLDGPVDFIAWDMANGPVNGPILGSGPLLGVTALSSGSYVDQYGTWIPNPTLGDWVATRTYNAHDIDKDGLPDLVFGSYATGGASDTTLRWAAGNGFGFNPSMPLGTIPDQPQNLGDLGDINCDQCTDWIGGPDDDGDKGSIYAAFGDCMGNFALTTGEIVDACSDGPPCAGSGSAHGMGMSQLYDWNCDGRLDLLTNHVETTGSTATVQYWVGNCGSFSAPSVVIGGGAIRSSLASPLRR
ncbi:MAG: hypothetical protein AAGC60_13700 [Acidobacteriota bacterium]